MDCARAFAIAAVALAGRAAADEPLDFAREAKALYRVAACGPGPLPDGFDPLVVARHCRGLDASIAVYRRRWLGRARPTLARIVPKGLPDRVVYPFGGGDLLTALVVFPDATEYTTLSLERAGDPRPVGKLGAGELAGALADALDKVNHLLRETHSLTTDLKEMVKGHLPGQLIYALVALREEGYEPVSLRYFFLAPDGAVQYVGDADADADERRPFARMELTFRAAGKPDAPLKTFRHIAANLDDKHLADDPGVVAHLASKGRVAAMTKAASYLLWWRDFSTIRGYLLEHMDFMISDSTGIPPSYARRAGFEQVAYGQLEDTFFPGTKSEVEALRALFARSKQKLRFRFGYPDKANHPHLLITRRKTP